MCPSVTLMVCTSGRARQLDRCLQSVVAGSDRPEQLVVVNGEDGQTPEVVAKHVAAFQDVVLLRHPNRSLATLRNIGMPHCSCEVVAMTDDDAVVGVDWLVTLRHEHGQDSKVGAIGGPVSGLSGSFASRVADTVVFPTPGADKPILTLPTVNMSYQRAAVKDVGEFDETFFRGEDVDFNWRLVRAGYSIRYEPRMKVRHEHRATIRGLYQQQWMYGRAYVLVRTKWPEMYSVYPHTFRSVRSWLKLGYAALSIVYLPLEISRKLPNAVDRLRAYPVLVGHHLVWKLGMVRQALSRGAGLPPPLHDLVVVERWRDGQRVDS
jgi:GT2 family glycosyltransferase